MDAVRLIFVGCRAVWLWLMTTRLPRRMHALRSFGLLAIGFLLRWRTVSRRRSEPDMGTVLSDCGAEDMVSFLDLASTAFPFGSDGGAIGVPPKEETVPSVAGVELPLPDAASSVPLFAVSSASMVITLAGGTGPYVGTRPELLYRCHLRG